MRKKSLLVPTEAIIQTGTRTVVMLAEDNGTFRPVDVQIGIESGGQTEIKRGLQAGQRVVVSSQFLIDSEASLKGIEARLNAECRSRGRAHRAAAHGRSDSREHRADAIMLSHGPIPSLKWRDMTMEFKLGAAGQAKAIAPGDRVRFGSIGVATTSCSRASRSSPGSQKMIAKLIHWSIANRFLVLLATVMVTAWGVISLLARRSTRCPTCPTCRSSSAPRIRARRRALSRTRSPIR